MPFRLNVRQLIRACPILLVIASTSIADEYAETIAEDRPVLFASFDESAKSKTTEITAFGCESCKTIRAKLRGATLGAAGPRPGRFPSFAKDNRAAFFGGSGDRIVISDAGEKSPLDFELRESITLEAWVSAEGDIGEGQQVYVIGKGRTGRRGFAQDNQNWALRLRVQEQRTVAGDQPLAACDQRRDMG
ncbi:MAG: hypothetical protein AAF517_27770 [Planctomycetota bacterium]